MEPSSPALPNACLARATSKARTRTALGSKSTRPTTPTPGRVATRSRSTEHIRTPVHCSAAATFRRTVSSVRSSRADRRGRGDPRPRGLVTDRGGPRARRRAPVIALLVVLVLAGGYLGCSTCAVRENGRKYLSSLGARDD